MLLERLKANTPARIIIVTAPSTSPLVFDDLQGEKHFGALNELGASKMANLLFTYALARRLQGTGVTANDIHPGLIKSNLMQQAALPMRVLLNLVSSGPDKGADTTIYLAADAQVANETGKFWSARKQISSNAYSYDTQIQERLWEMSESMTKEQV